MKKYIVFLSIVVLFQWVFTFCIVLDKHEEKKSTTFPDVYGYKNLAEINKAFLWIERKINKNFSVVQYKISTLLRRELMPAISSFSCDTNMSFLSPVCDEALAVNLEKSGFSNIHYDKKKDRYVIENSFGERTELLFQDEDINQEVTKDWYDHLFEINPYHGCYQQENQNRIIQYECAHYLSQKSEKYRNWTTDYIIAKSNQDNEKPITNYLKRVWGHSKHTSNLAL